MKYVWPSLEFRILRLLDIIPLRFTWSLKLINKLFTMWSLRTQSFVCSFAFFGSFLNLNVAAQCRGCAVLELHNEKSIPLCTADVQNSLKEIVEETIKIS